MGIEPMILPWQGKVLPLNYIRKNEIDGTRTRNFRRDRAVL